MLSSPEPMPLHLAFWVCAIKRQHYEGSKNWLPNGEKFEATAVGFSNKALIEKVVRMVLICSEDVVRMNCVVSIDLRLVKEVELILVHEIWIVQFQIILDCIPFHVACDRLRLEVEPKLSWKNSFLIVIFYYFKSSKLESLRELRLLTHLWSTRGCWLVAFLTLQWCLVSPLVFFFDWLWDQFSHWLWLLSFDVLLPDLLFVYLLFVFGWRTLSGFGRHFLFLIIGRRV